MRKKVEKKVVEVNAKAVRTTAFNWIVCRDAFSKAASFLMIVCLGMGVFLCVCIYFLSLVSYFPNLSIKKDSVDIPWLF